VTIRAGFVVLFVLGVVPPEVWLRLPQREQDRLLNVA
jgi:hypothetical protein